VLLDLICCQAGGTQFTACVCVCVCVPGPFFGLLSTLFFILSSIVRPVLDDDNDGEDDYMFSGSSRWCNKLSFICSFDKEVRVCVLYICVYVLWSDRWAFIVVVTGKVVHGHASISLFSVSPLAWGIGSKYIVWSEGRERRSAAKNSTSI